VTLASHFLRVVWKRRTYEPSRIFANLIRQQESRDKNQSRRATFDREP
jgi:hypothetical protein